MKKNIAIIGAGPAGIYTAMFLEKCDADVTLFEQNPHIGKKLRITGGGRMNVGNKKFSVNEFSSSSKNLLKRLFKNRHFQRRDEILEELGIDIVWEKNRAILQSGDAKEEVFRLSDELRYQENVVLELGNAVEKIENKDDGFVIDGKFFDAVILAQGGMYRMGDLKHQEEIYKLPILLGHTVTSVAPSLGALMFTDRHLAELSGLAFVGKLRDVKQKRDVSGDILITHIGLSGPAVLDFTAQQCSDHIELSFVPDISEEEFRVQINAERTGATFLRTFLKKFLPQRLVDEVLRRSKISADMQIANLQKKQLGELCKTLFRLRIPDLKDNIYPSCWTTCGGIPLGEVHTATLESKIISGLYFAGEILDVNGLCGGYNIGFASISARIVTDAIMNNSKK